jgi:hypothetical protein
MANTSEELAAVLQELGEQRMARMAAAEAGQALGATLLAAQALQHPPRALILPASAPPEPEPSSPPRAPPPPDAPLLPTPHQIWQLAARLVAVAPAPALPAAAPRAPAAVAPRAPATTAPRAPAAAVPSRRAAQRQQQAPQARAAAPAPRVRPPAPAPAPLPPPARPGPAPACAAILRVDTVFFPPDDLLPLELALERRVCRVGDELALVGGDLMRAVGLSSHKTSSSRWISQQLAAAGVDRALISEPGYLLRAVLVGANQRQALTLVRRRDVAPLLAALEETPRQRVERFFQGVWEGQDGPAAAAAPPRARQPAPPAPPPSPPAERGKRKRKAPEPVERAAAPKAQKHTPKVHRLNVSALRGDVAAAATDLLHALDMSALVNTAGESVASCAEPCAAHAAPSARARRTVATSFAPPEAPAHKPAAHTPSSLLRPPLPLGCFVLQTRRSPRLPAPARPGASTSTTAPPWFPPPPPCWPRPPATAKTPRRSSGG